MIQISIGGKKFSRQKVLNWENQHVQISAEKLSKKLKKPVHINDADDLALLKSKIGGARMLEIFKSELAFTNFVTNIVVRLSHGKRKFSIAEADLDFCNAETLHRMYDDMMLNNTPENRLSCLRANPDHYLLRGTGKNIQEVMECTGGLPVASLFDIHYGDFDGLCSSENSDYPLQAAGVSYLKNGLAIGDVRHQMKDTKNGCHVKLTVEFPALMLDRNIRGHEYHLACEFYNWFSEFERRIRKEQQ